MIFTSRKIFTQANQVLIDKPSKIAIVYKFPTFLSLVKRLRFFERKFFFFNILKKFSSSLITHTHVIKKKLSSQKYDLET